MKNIFKGKRILITGGSGSLGKALLEHIKEAKEVRILSRSERNQIPLKELFPSYTYILGDVRDYQTVRNVVRNIDIVIHAAAFKFLDLAEIQSMECVMTNVVGTINVINAVLDEKNVQICLGISTDKVCYARNVYGATKHIMEKLFREANMKGTTKFVCLRYGNIMGSTGALHTIWEKQIEKGKSLTVTDKRMKRFFLSTEDAIKAIVYTLEHVRGGKTFVLKVPSYSIYALARKLSKDIRITGIRPGEKLYETLIADYEGKQYTSQDTIHRKEFVILK